MQSLRAPDFDPATVDQHVHFAMDWRAFSAFLDARGEDGSTRIAYLDGELEIMAPSFNHELIKTNLSRMLEWWATEFDVEINGYGSVTLKKARQRAGLEPDECYFVGPRGGRTSPDFAIEVVWTRGLIDKLEVYRRLGVKEVWVWEQGALAPWVLSATGYTRAKKSRLLPELDFPLLARLASSENQHAAVKLFRAALGKH